MEQPNKPADDQPQEEVEGHRRKFHKEDESGEEQAPEEQSEGEDVEGHRRRFGGA